MEQYDWNKNLDMNIKMMKYLGLWPPSNINPGLYSIYTAIMVIIFMAGHVFSQTINFYFARNNLEAIAGIIYIVLIEYMAACKIYCIIKKGKVLRERISFLKSEWFQPRNINQKEIIESSIKFWRRVYKVLLALSLACNIFWMIFPLLDTSHREKRLPFLAWFPFDFRVSPFYEITYVNQVFSEIYLTLVHLNVDTLISGINVYTACQFDLLSDNVKNIRASHAEEDLMKCIIHHKEILKFIEGLSQFSSLIIFWHLILSGIAIGMTMFKLTLVLPFSNEFYSYLSYGLAITLEIFMYCWFGNEVEVKSNLVSYSVFECDWIDLPEKIKWKLLFFTMRVTKPVKISAFSIFYLSLDTFTKILKTAWSYFALLYQVGSQI